MAEQLRSTPIVGLCGVAGRRRQGAGIAKSHEPRELLVKDAMMERRRLLIHGDRGTGRHADVTLRALGERLAAALGMDYAGRYEDVGPEDHHTAGCFHLPRKTLIGPDWPQRLGLAGEEDLFGGWVPYDFMATKAIVHPLVSADASAPEGWSQRFGERAAEAALAGFTAFSAGDALEAGRRLLHQGAVRLKAVHADGGRAQVVARSLPELEAALEGFVTQGSLRDTLVVEEELSEVTTYSVGKLLLPGQVLTYCGIQWLTRNNSGATAYGGSELLVARGDFEALLVQPLNEAMRRAVDCARRFDRLADQELPAFLASRRNYDVAAGMSAKGEPRLGLLEQSWRPGGASGAELAALEAFRDEPLLLAVRARTVELYGEQPPPPAGATLYFSGRDPVVGLLTKYALVEERIVA